MGKIIEQIEALRIKKSGTIWNSGLTWGLNEAIATLRAEFEQKDMPNSEGLHINYDVVGESFYVRIDVIPYYFDKNGYRVNCKKGKWINLSSIMPESEV